MQSFEIGGEKLVIFVGFPSKAGGGGGRHKFTEKSSTGKNFRLSGGRNDGVVKKNSGSEGIIVKTSFAAAPKWGKESMLIIVMGKAVCSERGGKKRNNEPEARDGSKPRG